MFAPVFGGTHCIAAVGTAGFSGKQANGAGIKGFRTFCNHGLHLIPKFPINNRLMGSLHDIPFAFRAWFVLLRLIGNAAVFALHHVSDIDFIYQHIGDSKVFPERAVLPLGLLVTQTVKPFVLRGIWDASVVQHPRNGGFAIALRKEGEHFPDDCSGFFVNDQMPFLFRVFLVPIKSKSTDVKTVLSAVGENASDIIRHIL